MNQENASLALCMHLLAAFWPEQEPQAAVNSLNQALFVARRALTASDAPRASLLTRRIRRCASVIRHSSGWTRSPSPSRPDYPAGSATFLMYSRPLPFTRRARRAPASIDRRPDRRGAAPRWRVLRRGVERRYCAGVAGAAHRWRGGLVSCATCCLCPRSVAPHVAGATPAHVPAATSRTRTM